MLEGSLVEEDNSVYEEERAFKLACKILASQKKRTPWKTAEYLSKQLAKKGCFITEERLEDLFIAHFQSPNWEVRHSRFPAKRSLDRLWGHVSLVGKLETLPNIILDAEHEFYDPCNVPADVPWCFLSHSHRDLETVLGFRDKLLAQGYGVWIFEAEIAEQERITDAVQRGLDGSQIFIAYASRQSLRSRWVLKEMLVAFSDERLKPFVVIGAGDPELISFFHKWLVSGWADVNLEEETTHLLRESDEQESSATEILALLQDLGNCRDDRRHLVIYPDVPFTENLLLEWDSRLLTFDKAFPQRERLLYNS